MKRKNFIKIKGTNKGFLMKSLILACALIFSFSAMANQKATEKLFDAVENNNIKKARRAIEDGANVNARTTSTSILLRAIRLQEIEITKLLLDNKADINQVRSIDLFSGLMIAAKHNNASMAKLLISRGANVNLVTPAMRNALHIAALNNSLAVAEILVKETNIDVNAREGLCALAVASRQDHREIVTLLKNLQGSQAPSAHCLERAIDMADFNDHSEVLKILRS